MSDSSDTNVSPVLNKGKRKAVVLSDSMRESDSSSTSELDESVIKRNGKRKARIRESDSDSSIEKRKIKRIPRVASDSDGSSSSSSSSDESEIIRTKKLSRNRVVLSDHSDNNSSRSSDVDVGFEDNTSTSDEWESDWVSDSETAVAEPAQPINTSVAANVSDSSDGDSEKCPICLLSFNQQEVGTPETCDHSFCAECIQEWSKNVNTCPVDRQTFTLILVRKRYNGKVIRRVPVDVRRPSEDELIHEDPTYCEICGMSDREDRLLLCDGCDLGYHLECLDPPMDTVPVEEWFCGICSGRTSQQHHQQQQQQQQRLRIRNEQPRLMPRTSQSERIRATIETNRHNYAAHNDQQSISSGFEDVSMPGTSHSGSNSNSTGRNGRRSTQNGTSTTRKKKSRRRKRRAQYTITYEICETTGEKVAIKTRKKTRRKARRRKKKSQRRTIKPKTVKKRLAFQLGMCPPKSAGLAVPEVKVKANTSTTGHIGYQRTQAGIPTLHLFGQRDSLDYFSGSDEEVSEMSAAGAGSASRILTQSRGHLAGGMSALRRAARRKAAVLSPLPPVSVNSCDILGSILDSQAKLHSKHSKLSVTRDGTIRIENEQITKPCNNNNNNNEPPLDLTSSRNNELETTQAPMFPGRGGNNRQPYGFNRGGYRSNYDGHGGSGGGGGNYNNFQAGGNRGRGNYGFGNNPRDIFTGGGNYMNFHHHGGPPPFRGRGPPRFPIRRPQYAQQQHQHHHYPQNEAQNQFREEEEAEEETAEPVDLVLDDATDQQADASRLQEQEDVDIYSDIEDNVQTQEEEEEAQAKPPPPPPQVDGPPMQGLVSQAYNNSDDDDSGSELIIDDTKDDKIEATTPTDNQSELATNLTTTTTEQIENTNVIVETEKVEESTENRQMQPSFSQQVVKQVVQEVLQEHLNTPVKKSNVEYDDDEMSNDDCPNFSIYSSTSIDIAKATDFSVDIPSEKPEEPHPQKDKHQENEQTNMDDEWPSGDEWDACDAENAQKSWDQPYQPPENKTTSNKIAEPEEPIIESEQNSKKEEENESDSQEEEEPAVIATENIEDDKRSPTPEPIEPTESIPQTLEQNTIISESLTPPLPLPATSNLIASQRAPEKIVTPIKIAFNPSTRKLQKTTPFAEKEKVIQLYDDSDYEEWELKNDDKTLKQNETEETTTNNAEELEKLTEAISEEERSYTPCLDEKDPTKLQYSEDEKNMGGAGIGGMDTEMISDDERNEFDESHDMKTISDGDALEINAKESELELARPEDYEEGEIVEKAGVKPQTSENKAEAQPDKSLKVNVSEDEKKKRPKKKLPEKEPDNKDKQTENEKAAAKKSEFKKISKSNKERNYRDKERSKSKEHAKGKENREANSKEELRKKKERKRDLERYNVRSIIADKPKKDQFGRDIKSPSRSSRSLTPRRSRSHSWNRAKKRRRRTSRSPRRSRSRSHTPRSRSRGRSARRSRSFRRSKSPRRSRSRSFRRSRTPKNKRHREVKSLSRERDRVRYRNRSRRSADRPQRKKKNRSTSRNRMRSRTPSPAKHRMRNEWPRQGETYTREWTPSWSRSPTPPRPIQRHNLPQSMSPSWTPPIAIDKGPVQPENLTVILNNDVNKTKKKEKRKKADKKQRDEYRKRKRADRTPPPSKEVFASGDNILVSVSFNKTNEESSVQREVMGVKRKRDSVSDSSKKKKDKNGEKKKKRAKSPRTKKKNKEIANLKPVAIIDLDRSPFKELTPSPKDIIVLSDSDICEKEDEAMMVHHHEMLQEELMALGAQIQEDSAPQSPNNYLNTTGPKTPPEPQIKFLLTSKQSQLRAINNPLHDPNDEVDPEIDPQEELEHRLDDILHKGPNTPPEPPSSPPSSPDAYDPFDPTKSRSPTPEPPQNQPVLNTPGDTKESESDLVDLAVGPLESSQQKSTCSLNESAEKQIGSQSPERPQTRTPPINSEQTTDSNENNKSDLIEKSPERNPIGVIINQQVQLPAVVKPIIPTSSPSIIANTSLPPRANLFNTSAPVGGAPRIATSVPQRIILPTPSKSSPAKTSPSKPPIKSTPIKPMPSSKTMISKLPVPNMKPLTPIRKGAPAKPANRNTGQNGNEIIDVDLDFDSPYSPGSSDYEDLFEPPAETVKTNTRQQKNTKSPAKQNAFDNLFGSSPVFRNNKTNTSNNKSKTNAAKIPVKMNKKTASNPKANSKTVGVKIDEDNLKILDDLPNSAVEMQVKDKFLKKLNRQERVVEEVKLVLKPHYNKKHVTKEQYKDILRRAVPKICHNRSGEINPKKIQNLIEAYVKKARHARKTSNPSNQGANSVAQQPKPAKTTFWS